VSEIANTIFSPELAARFDKLVTIYPLRRSALVPMLLYAQDEIGYVSDAVIAEIAQRIGILELDVRNVLSYYSMLRTKPAGKYNVQVCTNISCMLRGGYDILHHVEKRLGIKAGETTADGAFTVVEEECLAACANAPMMICGDDYFLDLTPQKVDAILDDLRKRWREQQKTAAADHRTLLGIGPGGAKG
jgi:NADH-quinone oxidoreductase subunit E